MSQALSAAFAVRSFESPNTASLIAGQLAETGRYEVPNWYRAQDANAGAAAAPLRAYHLPGEVIYLASAFRVVPRALWPFLHVPVTALLVFTIAAVGLAIGGRTVALFAGLAASVDPFMLAHGPVWDDVFLGAALAWAVFAIVLTASSSGAGQPALRSWRVWIAGACAGWAAITRAEFELVLALVAVGLLLRPKWRPLRAFGAAILVGVVVASAAWAVRNASVLGRVVLGSTHDGVTLYESNSAHASDAISKFGEAGGTGLYYEPRTFAARAASGEVDANQAFLRDAIGYGVAHPVAVAGTSVFKLAVSLSGIDLGQPIGRVRNLAALARCAVLLVLGALGLWRWQRRSIAAGETPFGLVLAATSIATCGVLLAGPVGERYWIAAAGFLYVGVGVFSARYIVLHEARV